MLVKNSHHSGGGGRHVVEKTSGCLKFFPILWMLRGCDFRLLDQSSTQEKKLTFFYPFLMVKTCFNLLFSQ